MNMTKKTKLAKFGGTFAAIATAVLVRAQSVLADTFTTFDATSSKDVVVGGYNQVVAFYLLVIGALLTLGLTVAGIWWGYHKVKSIIRARRRL